MASVSELACTYAALILHDDDVPITAEQITTLTKAAGVAVEPYWPALFAKLFANRSIGDMIANVGAGGGGGAVAAPGGGGGGGGGAAPKEEVKEEEEEEEEDEEWIFIGHGLLTLRLKNPNKQDHGRSMHPIIEEIRQQLASSKAHPAPWTQDEWWDAFVFTFYFGPKHGLRPDTDGLLFLVLLERSRHRNDNPYTVIRQMETIPPEFTKEGTQFDKIDWRSTLELNLVMQTTFHLTVSICNAEEVELVRNGLPLDASTSRRVTKHVQASTVTVGLSPRREKAEKPIVCYPNVCFCVEDFDDLFGSMVLSEEGQLFCVVLNSAIGFGQESSRNCPPGNTDSQGEEGPIGSLIFGGVVSFDVVKNGLLGTGQCLPRRILQERTVKMNGPNGHGMAEVFTSIDAESDAEAVPVSETPDRLAMFRRGVQSAREYLFGTEAKGPVVELTEESRVRFRCLLMTLTLPVTSVALKMLES